MKLKNILLLKRSLVKLTAVVCLTFITNVYGKEKIISKLSPVCEIDLNGDKIDDFVFLVYDWKVFALLTIKPKPPFNENYQLHFFKYGKANKSDVFLYCYKKNYITETPAGPGKREEGRKIKVPTGSYFEIVTSECCSTAYYWENNKFFKQVTTVESDCCSAVY